MIRINQRPWGYEEVLFEQSNSTVKILHTYRNLSVQIHPSKDEQFTLISYESSIISDPYILMKQVSSYEQCLASVDIMNKVPLKIGVPSNICYAGTLHMIPAGLTLLEVSWGDDITLRVKDWYGRSTDYDALYAMFND